MEFVDLKKNYSILEKKYRLPAFDKLNEDFEIDKIDKESDLLLRYVRKIMMEKIVNSIGFLEMLLNPVNAPRIYISYVRSMTAEDKKIIDEMYSALGNLSVSALELEIDCSEKSEAEIIKHIYEIWQQQKPKFRKIINNLKKPNNIAAKKEKSYFG